MLFVLTEALQELHTSQHHLRLLHRNKTESSETTTYLTEHQLSWISCHLDLKSLVKFTTAQRSESDDDDTIGIP